MVQIFRRHAGILQQLDVSHVESVIAPLLANAVVVERLVARRRVLAPDFRELDVDVFAQVFDVFTQAFLAEARPDLGAEITNFRDVVEVVLHDRIVDPCVQLGIVLAGARQAGVQVLGGGWHGAISFRFG